MAIRSTPNLLNRRKDDKAWDVDANRVPINQEDMAVTLLAFTPNALDGVEFVGGMAVSKKDQEDYLALWRYLGWVLGVYTSHDDDKRLPSSTTTTTPLLPTPSLDPCGWYKNYPKPLQHARHQLQSILLHLLHPDESSVAVSHNLSGVGGKTLQREKPKTEGEETRAPVRRPLFQRSVVRMASIFGHSIVAA